MNSQMSPTNLPKKIGIYFTSESNSYGAIGKEWLDSKPFKQVTPLKSAMAWKIPISLKGLEIFTSSFPTCLALTENM